MIHFSTKYYSGRACLQCVVVTAIRITASLEDDRLERDVYSGSCGMDGIDRHEPRRGSSVEIAPFLVRYHVSFPAAFVP
jgi:hypothetical protein